MHITMIILIPIFPLHIPDTPRSTGSAPSVSVCASACAAQQIDGGAVFYYAVGPESAGVGDQWTVD